MLLDFCFSLPIDSNYGGKFGLGRDHIWGNRKKITDRGS